MTQERLIATLLSRVGEDVEAGAKLLKVAATYLKQREPLPDDLADYLADAFLRATNEHGTERGKELAWCLGLTGSEGRPKKKVPPLEIARALDEEHGITEGALKRRIAKEHDVSESTARNRIKSVKRSVEIIAEIVEENGGSLVQRRKPKVQEPR